MQLDGVRQQVFLDRYSLKDENGKPLEKTPDEMWRRVAKGLSLVEESPEKQKEWEEKFYNVMRDFKFLPGGRILAGAGTGFDVTYFNCFVLPSPPDNRKGIIDNLSDMIEIMARGGGVGINLSSLRPRRSRVKKVNGFSSGPVNWAQLHSVATREIVQQGGTRRGALMLMLHDWHPDVEEFTTIKEDLTKLTGANLSVCVSDKFMEAVKKDGDWSLEFPDLNDPEYDEKWNGELDEWKALGKKTKVYKTTKAKKLWDIICQAAWRSAEPGLHFLERSNKQSNTWYFEKLVATNPCGEQPLSPWAVCNLGAMNLLPYVKDSEGGNPIFDFDSFGKDVQVAMRLLDNVIDDTYYFYEQNEKCAKNIRRTGLGILGLGDALIKMRLRYGSNESLPVVRKIFETLRDNAYYASTEISREKGSFPLFDKEQYLRGWFINLLPEPIRKKIADDGIRNAILLTIAPTGTTSLISGVTSGIEPVYEFEFIRRDRLGEHRMYHPLYEEWKKAYPNDPKPDYFVSANDLTPEDHVRVQAIAQEYIDSSISKTVNAPSSHTVEDVNKLYTMAYDMGLKGITYMRDGSREGVLSRIDDKKEEKPKHPLKRPLRVDGSTYEIQTPVGQTFVTINHDKEGNPLEVFLTLGKTGSDVTAMSEGMGRLISLILRLNPEISARERIKLVIKHLVGIGGTTSIGFGKERVRSLPDAVAKVLSRHFEFSVNGKVEDKKEEKTSSLDICPECGVASLVHEEGCAKCYSCGFSKC